MFPNIQKWIFLLCPIILYIFIRIAHIFIKTTNAISKNLISLDVFCLQQDAIFSTNYYGYMRCYYEKAYRSLRRFMLEWSQMYFLLISCPLNVSVTEYSPKTVQACTLHIRSYRLIRLLFLQRERIHYWAIYIYLWWYIYT